MEAPRSVRIGAVLATALLLAQFASASILGVSADSPALPQHRENVWEPQFPSQKVMADLPTSPSTTSTKRSAAKPGYASLPLYGNFSASTSFFNFYAEISVGTPAQKLKMLFDTRMDSIWVFSRDSGFLSIDKIQIDNFVTPSKQFGEVDYVKGIPDFADLEIDGVFGLGSCPWKTPLEVLVEEGALDEPVFGLYFDKKTKSGELSLGRSNKTHYVGELNYADSQSDVGWTVKLDGVTVDKHTFAKDDADAFVWSSLPFVWGPNDEVEKLKTLVGAKPNGDIDCSSNGEPDIVIGIGGIQYPLTKEDYTIRPSDSPSNCVFAFVGINENKRWLLGQPFLQKYYTVFDWGTKERRRRIGFALAK